MKLSKEIEYGSIATKKRLSSHLLFITPMNMVVKENDTESTDTEKTPNGFQDNAYILFFKDIFSLYKINVQKWVISLLGVNWGVKRSITKQNEKPLVICCNL